jgi:hypothetical protein
MTPTRITTRQVLYYGHEQELPEQEELRAGPLQLIFEQGDLRYIRLEDNEILRRIYMALRDRNWGTAPARLSRVEKDIAEDSFLIRYHADHIRDEIDFAWNGELRGDPDGKITFSMEGIARSTFWRNRIGFCVLHPANLSGCPAEVLHSDGSFERTVFPTDFIPEQPVQPFAELRRISHQIAPGTWAEVTFQGDVFEMEDQRNWTDASFKTFCTPLRLPFPVEIRQGTKISQSITICLRESDPKSSQSQVNEISTQPSRMILSIDRGAEEQVIPAIGLGMASHGQPLTSTEIERLRHLNLAHLRVDLALYDPNAAARLRQAADEAQSLGARLEIALFVSEQAERELSELRRELDSLQPPVSAWLCYPKKEVYQGEALIEAAAAFCRKTLEDFDPSIPIFCGTNSDLIFLQRSVPPLEKIQGLCFAICPQAHAFDNASLVETLEVQGKAVQNALRLGKGLPVRVSPVTLKMRFNPYATGPVPELQPGELPPQVDVRQMSLFGAGWTAGSFKYLAEAGARTVTFYETTGWRGVMETEGGSPLPEIFRSLPGTVFPVYHVLANIADFRGGKIVPMHSSHPLQTIGLLLRRNQTDRILIANLSPHRKAVKIETPAGQASVRFLDERNVLDAVRSPELFRPLPGIKLDGREGFLDLELLPFAIAIVDAKPDNPAPGQA